MLLLVLSGPVKALAYLVSGLSSLTAYSTVLKLLCSHTWLYELVGTVLLDMSYFELLKIRGLFIISDDLDIMHSCKMQVNFLLPLIDFKNFLLLMWILF